MSKPVPMSKWGRDHWSLLAYIETRVVDHHGYLDNRQMQPRNTKYEVRLRGFDLERPETYIVGYGDWGILDDFIATGLIVPGPDAMPTSPTGRLQYRDMKARTKRPMLGWQTNQVRLTEKGMLLASQLRRHKGSGGNFADFVPKRVRVSKAA